MEVKEFARKLAKKALDLPKEVVVWCLIDGHAGVYAWHEFFEALGWHEAASYTHPDKNPEWVEDVDRFLDPLNEALEEFNLIVFQGESGDIFLGRRHAIKKAKAKDLGHLAWVPSGQETLEVVNRVGGGVLFAEPPTGALVKVTQGDFEEVWFTWDKSPWDSEAEFERWV